MTEGKEDIITLGSSSEEEEDDDVLPMVPAPRPPGPKIGISTPPRKGVQVIRLAASVVGPKIEAKPICILSSSSKQNGEIKPKMNAITGNPDIVICLSSDDEEEKVPELKSKETRSPNQRRGQQQNSIDDEKPCTSAAARSSPVVSNGGSGSPSDFTLNGAAGESHTVQDETNDEHAKDVLQDDDEDKKSQRSDADSGLFCSEAAAKIKTLLKVLRPKLSFKDRGALGRKIWRKYEKLAGEPAELHDELAKRIALVIDHVRDNLDMNFWKLLKQLFTQFNANVLNNESFIISYTEDEKQNIEKKKQKQLKTLELKLKKYSEIVKQLDEEEVNWDSDDESNSSFMQRERTIARIMKIHNLICKMTKSSKHTGRPIQKAINVKNTTMYPEVEKAVEKFVNSTGYSEAPEFLEILKVVESSSAEFNLHLSETDRKDLAKTLHKAVIERRQRLRELDVPLAYPAECDQLHDPAEQDPELEEKLKNNAKVATSIKSVIDDFAARQTAASDEAVENEGVVEDEDHEEEDDEDESDDEQEDDSTSIIDTGACFVTSVEEEEDAAVEAWNEPLFEGEEDSLDEQKVPCAEDLAAADSNTRTVLTRSNSEAETIVAEVENGIEENVCTKTNGECNSVAPCEESSNGVVDESPPTKKSKVDNLIEDPECGIDDNENLTITD